MGLGGNRGGGGDLGVGGGGGGEGGFWWRCQQLKVFSLGLLLYSKAPVDRNRLRAGSQSISKCARETGRTVSQFLNVYGQVSQFLNVPPSAAGPDAYLSIKRPGSISPGLQCPYTWVV